jgi:hypothetical protein
MSSNSNPSTLTFAQRMAMFGKPTSTAAARVDAGVEAAKSSGLPSFAGRYLNTVGAKMKAKNANNAKANNATRKAKANANAKAKNNARKKNANATRNNANTATINKMSSKELTDRLIESLDVEKNGGKMTEAQENFFKKLQKKREETMDEIPEDESFHIKGAYMFVKRDASWMWDKEKEAFLEKLKKWQEKQQARWSEEREERDRKRDEEWRKEIEKEDDVKLKEYQDKILEAGGEMQDFSKRAKLELRMLLRNRLSRSQEMFEERKKYIMDLEESGKWRSDFDLEEREALYQVDKDKEKGLTLEQIQKKHGLLRQQLDTFNSSNFY